MSINVSMTISDPELNMLLSRLSTIPKKVQKKYMRRGVMKGARVVARAAMAKVPVESGTLRRSIGATVRTRGFDIVGIVGPRRNMGRIVAVQTTGGKFKGKQRAGKKQIAAADNVRLRTPTRYAHLVEFGDGGRRAFMRPAWDASKPAIIMHLRNELRLAVAEANRGTR